MIFKINVQYDFELRKVCLSGAFTSSNSGFSNLMYTCQQSRCFGGSYISRSILFSRMQCWSRLDVFGWT